MDEQVVSRTYVLGSGVRVRPQSQRRYVLVNSRGQIEYRSDVLDRVRARTGRTDFIIDQVAGKVRATVDGRAVWS